MLDIGIQSMALIGGKMKKYYFGKQFMTNQEIKRLVNFSI